MAKSPSVNNIVTGPQAIYNVIATLIAAGWTGQGWSDGTTYSATGQHASAATLVSTGAWQRVREPGGRREWVFQRGTTNVLWRVKYSALARFTGGSPGAVRVPSATDEQVLFGSGTDAAPTGATLFNGDSTYRAHVCADSTPVNGAYPFVLYCSTVTTGARAPGYIYQDPMIVGSNDSSDGDPVAVGMSAVTTGGQWTASFWLAFGTASATWVTGADAGTGCYGNTHPAGATVKASAQLDSLNHTPVRAFYAASAGGLYRPKGFGHYIKLRTQNQSYGATATKATDCHAYWDTFVLPFANATDPAF